MVRKPATASRPIALAWRHFHARPHIAKEAPRRRATPDARAVSHSAPTMPRFAANLSFLYGEFDFLDRFAAAAADGF
ncbi:MAG TPA: hypothetical protein P5024_13730, partial [Burkholderiaceae bacterium]|nr:hypothetical protein [Burkholderiaceae bacterium]